MPKMADAMMVVNDVDSVTVRAVMGDGDLIELWIRTRSGDLTIRLHPRRGRAIRLTNLRRRDKRQTPKLTVPFLKGEQD